jgi:urease accessory protein
MLLATPALAHNGLAGPHGFLHGLAHLFLGADHLLAMVTVGLWSGFVLTTRVWAGAAAFLGAMVAGAAMSWAGIGFAGAEALTVASVLVFGVLTLVSGTGQAGWQTVGTLVTIAGFALAHGHAHATEAVGALQTYLAGFLIATAGLHLGGLVIARCLSLRGGVQQTFGAAITLSGLVLAAT